MEAWRFAGTDDNRQNLHSIHFEPERIGNSKAITIHAITTDGHRLLHASWPAGKGDVLSEAIDISPIGVRDFLKAIGKPKVREKPPSFRLKREGYRSDHKSIPEYFLGTDSGRMMSVSIPPTFDKEGKLEEKVFPQWQHIIPRQVAEQQSFSTKFGVNFDYVDGLARYLRSSDMQPNVVVHYSDESGLGPVLFECLPDFQSDAMKADVEYVLMPVRT